MVCVIEMKDGEVVDFLIGTDIDDLIAKAEPAPEEHLPRRIELRKALVKALKQVDYASPGQFTLPSGHLLLVSL